MKGDRNPERRRPCSCIGLAFGQRAPIANAAMRFRMQAIALRHRSRAIDRIDQIDRINRIARCATPTRTRTARFRGPFVSFKQACRERQ
jgi:hypothetical protein